MKSQVGVGGGMPAVPALGGDTEGSLKFAGNPDESVSSGFSETV